MRKKRLSVEIIGSNAVQPCSRSLASARFFEDSDFEDHGRVGTCADLYFGIIKETGSFTFGISSRVSLRNKNNSVLSFFPFFFFFF